MGFTSEHQVVDDFLLSLGAIGGTFLAQLLVEVFGGGSELFPNLLVTVSARYTALCKFPSSSTIGLMWRRILL
jgi:hypothetical protein